MYTPGYAKSNNTADIKQFIRENGFGILVSNNSQKITATHIPFEFSSDESHLVSHLSRANPQAKNFTPGAEVLAIFSGPNAYISSSWYDHENVPTWNYIAAHVYGKIRILTEHEAIESLNHLLKRYEGTTLANMSSQYVNQQVKGLLAIEIEITNIEATYKLSQNRDQKNYDNIIHELERKNEPGAIKIADEMKKRKG